MPVSHKLHALININYYFPVIVVPKPGMSLLALGSRARGKGSSGDIWFDWLKAFPYLTLVFRKYLLVESLANPSDPYPNPSGNLKTGLGRIFSEVRVLRETYGFHFEFTLLLFSHFLVLRPHRQRGTGGFGDENDQKNENRLSRWKNAIFKEKKHPSYRLKAASWGKVACPSTFVVDNWWAPLGV